MCSTLFSALSLIRGQERQAHTFKINKLLTSNKLSDVFGQELEARGCWDRGPVHSRSVLHRGNDQQIADLGHDLLQVSGEIGSESI